MPAEPGQKLSHYHLLEKIGEGGMGVVWKARDTVLGRTVAIKVLSPDHARDEKRRSMFLAEARLASSIGHSHIVQVHELGREGELDFIVMEYVDGRPLHLVTQGRPLPPEQVAEIGHQVARGLAQAHRKGLLHRDLKPANVLITKDGEVKVVDFGLATLTAQRDVTLASHEVTRTSAVTGEEPPADDRPATILGTLPYMSPEQIRREPLDAHTDIFSLGVVLYEMTTGRRPFLGTSERELAEGILAADPIPPFRLVPTVPLELNRIILKAMARRPSDRFQTMQDLAVDLKRLGRELESGSSPSYEDLQRSLKPTRRRRRLAWASAGAVIAAALLLAGGWLSRPWLAPRTDASTVLVAPLEVDATDPATAYLGRATAEALAVNLARAPALRVLPVPPPVEPGGDAAIERARGARRLGAGRLLGGNLVRRGDTFHASLSLLDTADNRILWGTQAQVAESDLNELVARIASQVADRLGAEFPREYDYVGNLTGGAEMTGSPDTATAMAAIRRGELRSALEATARLVREFPEETEAHVMRTQALLLHWDANPSPENREEMETSMRIVERADPASPYAQFWRAYMAARDGDYDRGLEGYGRVLARHDLTPTARAWILRWRSTVHSGTGNDEAALADLEESLALDPTNAWTLALLGAALNDLGRPDDAVTYARQAVALAPSYWRNHMILGEALEQRGEIAQALEAYQRSCSMSSAQLVCALQAVALQRHGRPEQAREAAERAMALTADPGGLYNLACYWSWAGDRDRALESLGQARDAGHRLSGAHEDPDLAALRGDPRFERLLEEAARP